MEPPQKRLHWLLRAWARLPRGRAVLHVYGDTVLSQRPRDWQDLARALGIGSEVVWHGWVRQPWTEIKAASALVLPSTYEGFGLVLVEALARGIPVIAANCPVGPADVVMPGVNGWLFPPGDDNALARILSQLIDGSLPWPSDTVCQKSVIADQPTEVARAWTRHLTQWSIDIG